MSKSLEEKIIKEFTKKYESFELGEPVNIKQYRLLKSFIKKTLAQYKREIREKIEKKKKDYRNNKVFMTTDGSLSNYHESGYYEKKGFNDAINDVLTELDKLNHTDKKEGGK